MFVVGLTGGIGSGKSAVSNLFAKLGVPVIDADVVSREVVQPGQPALNEILKQFGAEALNADGNLNRQWLRAHVFARPEAKKQLEDILHPIIRQNMREKLESIQAPYAIFAIPLLFETGQNQSVDRILVVDCSLELQVSRVVQRDDSDEAQARAIIASQTERNRRLAGADDVIDNSGSLEALESIVKQLHEKYLTLAS